MNNKGDVEDEATGGDTSYAGNNVSSVKHANLHENKRNAMSIGDLRDSGFDSRPNSEAQLPGIAQQEESCEIEGIRDCAYSNDKEPIQTCENYSETFPAGEQVETQKCGKGSEERGSRFHPHIEPSSEEASDHVKRGNGNTLVRADRIGLVVSGDGNVINITNNQDFCSGHQHFRQKLEITCSSGQPFPEREAIELINGAQFKNDFETRMKFENGVTVTLLYARQGCIELVLQVPDQQSKTKLEVVTKSGEMTNLISKLLTKKFGSVVVKTTTSRNVVATGSNRQVSNVKIQQQLPYDSAIPGTTDLIKRTSTISAGIKSGTILIKGQVQKVSLLR